MNARLLFATTFLAAVGAAVPTDDEVDQARATLAHARTEKESAYAVLEAMIADLRDDYEALTTGPQALAHRQALALAMADSLGGARARIAARTGEGRVLLRGLRRQILEEAFAEPVQRACPVDERLCAWVSRQVANALSRQTGPLDLKVEDLRQLVGKLFPADTTWYEFWNESFHADLPEAKRHRQAWEAYERAGARLERLLHPERYGPKGEEAPPGMVAVPGGAYELGPNTGWERPARKVTLKAFFLDRREVTQGEYVLFVNGQPPGARPDLLPRGWTLGAQGRVDESTIRRNHPVAYVSWEQAAAYATWAGKRLPTEDEWEAAAGGVQGQVFPWGNSFAPGMVHGAEDADDTVPVESFPHARSPVGCLDMAGNVWEWTSTLEDGSSLDELPDGLVNVVIRGGSYQSRREELTTRSRWTAPGHDTFASPRYVRPIGFRCAKDLP